MLERRLDDDAPSVLCRCRRRRIGRALKRRNKRGTAVGIARVVHRVHADVDVRGTDALRIADGIAEEDEVAGGHVRDGYVCPLRVALRDINGTVGQRRAADGVHIRFDDEMLCRMVVSGNALCRIQLTTVALMVVKADRIELLSRRMGDRHAGAAVQSAREQNDRAFSHTVLPSLNQPRSDAMAADTSAAP